MNCGISGAVFHGSARLLRKYGYVNAVIMAQNCIIAQREYEIKLLKINSIKVTTGDLKQDIDLETEHLNNFYLLSADVRNCC